MIYAATGCSPVHTPIQSLGETSEACQGDPLLCVFFKCLYSVKRCRLVISCIIGGLVLLRPVDYQTVGPTQFWLAHYAMFQQRRHCSLSSFTRQTICCVGRFWLAQLPFPEIPRLVFPSSWPPVFLLVARRLILRVPAFPRAFTKQTETK
jgi:hypothetical protein